MGECNLDKFEREDLLDVRFPDIDGEVYFCRRRVHRNVETYWTCDISCIDENNNCILTAKKERNPKN
jgi:hypothetical protein